MNTLLSLLFAGTLCLSYQLKAQNSTLYYNDRGELTMAELATHYRIGEIDTAARKFIGEVWEFRMDSTVLSRADYDSVGMKSFYVFNEQGDTTLKASSREELQYISDSITIINENKDLFSQAKFIRKNDYPLISEMLSELIMKKYAPSFFTPNKAEPGFPGGNPALFKFLGKHIYLPDRAREYNVSGRVVVEFVVEKDGRINDVNIVRGLGLGCDEIASATVSRMPDWIPGYMNGKPVKVRLALPVIFR